MIYAVRVTSGRETVVADLIASKVKEKNLKINSISCPAEIKGYIFLEGDIEEIMKAIYGVMNIKSVIYKPVKVDEIAYFFKAEERKKIVINIGDVVEIIGGPFKGEKGKVQSFDKNKQEVTVELLEAAIPIPVTISTNLVKIVKKG